MELQAGILIQPLIAWIVRTQLPPGSFPSMLAAWIIKIRHLHSNSRFYAEALFVSDFQRDRAGRSSVSQALVQRVRGDDALTF